MRGLRRPVCFICFIFVAAIYIILEVSGGVDLSETLNDNRKVFLEGIINSKSQKNGEEILIVEADSDVKHKNYKVYLDAEHFSVGDYKIGQRIQLEGKYKNFALAENEGQFNSRKYYRVKGYDASIKKANVIGVSKKFNRIQNGLFETRSLIEEMFLSVLSTEQAGIMIALVLGDKDYLDDDVKAVYQDAGIAHILSLSGLHIATVGMALLSFLKRRGLSIKMCSVISVTIMILYGIMTGLSTSTIRALIMFILGVIAKCIGRTYDLLTAVAFSAILLLIDKPFYVYDSGFLLSISAVLGIGIIYPLIKMKNRSKILDGLAVSMSATLATLPVVMSSFYKLSRFGVLINLLVVPLVAVLLFDGILAGGSYLVITVFYRIVPGLFLYESIGLHKIISNLVIPAKIILKAYDLIANKTASLKDNMWITGAPTRTQCIVYIILLLAGTLFAGERISALEKLKIGHLNVKKVIGVLFILCAITVISIRPKGDFEYRAVSVGQGACNIIYGKNSPTIMFDGGSSDVKEVGKYRIEPVIFYNGIDTIDYVFISHNDADHISGIKEMLIDERCPVKIKRVFMSIKDDELCKLCIQKQIEFHIINKDDQIRDKDIKIECLNPVTSPTDTWKNRNGNDASIVLKVTHEESGMSVLLTGDISEEVEEAILPEITESTVLAVPHHGSRYSSSKAFLEKVNPIISIISCGKGNSYGHPHKETLERFNKYAKEGQVFRTDEGGEVIIRVKKNGVTVKRFWVQK